MRFTIESVKRHNSETVRVLISLDPKEWSAIRKSGNLGHFYCTEIGNELYRNYGGLRAYNPTVNDRDRAVNGKKWLCFYYTDNTWTAAPDNVILFRRRA